MQGHESEGDGEGRGPAPDLDLVEYVVISVPELSSAVDVADALKDARRVRADPRSSTWSGWSRASTGDRRSSRPDLLSALAALDGVDGEVGGLLSEDDVMLAGSAPPPGDVGTGRGRGGPVGVAAGRRGPAEWRPHHRRGADPPTPVGAVPTRTRVRAERLERTREARDPLAAWPRRPAAPPSRAGARAGDASPGSDAVRRVDQLRALLRLVERGVLSAEEFERQEEKVFRRSPGT